MRLLFLALLNFSLTAHGWAQDTRSIEGRSEEETHRLVAVTVDDLPGVFQPGQGCDAAALRDLTRRLVEGLVQSRVPATGFVNESKLCDRLRSELMPELLSMWLDAGHDLGNHTYSHRAFYADPSGQLDPNIEEYRVEVLRGEVVTRSLLAQRGRVPRYFRHPYLRTGPNDKRKAAFDSLLTGLGYEVAPVTIDNSEWVYAGAYARALARDDTFAAHRIGEAYLTHMTEMFSFFEDLSRDVLGREAAQVLLIHANDLNADYLKQLADLLRERGYSFVTLSEALADEAYLRGDVYTGARGRSWLQRWHYAETGAIREEPKVLDWVWEALRE